MGQDYNGRASKLRRRSSTTSSSSTIRWNEYDDEEKEEEEEERKRSKCEQRIRAWFDHMVARSGDRPAKGGQALEQYCLLHRGSLWQALVWKHGQSSVSPIVAAHLRSKFSRLDVVATIHNFLLGETTAKDGGDHSPHRHRLHNDSDSDRRNGQDVACCRHTLLDFWRSDILQQRIRNAASEFLELVLGFFIGMLAHLLFHEGEGARHVARDSSSQANPIYRLLRRYLREESMHIICKHVLPSLNDNKLLSFYHNLVAALASHSASHQSPNAEYISTHKTGGRHCNRPLT